MEGGTHPDADTVRDTEMDLAEAMAEVMAEAMAEDLDRVESGRTREGKFSWLVLGTGRVSEHMVGHPPLFLCPLVQGILEIVQYYGNIILIYPVLK